MKYRVEHFWAGGFLFGKVNASEMDARINELAEMGWRVTSTAALNRFFGETHHLMVLMEKDD